KDIINSNVVNTVCLTEIYRQSAKSDIIMGAHSVKAGEHISFKSKDTDLYYIETNSVEETKKELESLLTHRIKNFFGEDLALNTQVITPIKKTEIGTHELNKLIQGITLNPNDEMRHRKVGDRVFYENDKVMQVKNNYDINWDLEGVQGTGIYNGDIGYIETINAKDEYLIVDFDGKKTRYDFDELDQLEHAYAVTVHKSQGSEFDAVIIPLYVCFEKLFNRNLIYTAMTRAKRLLIFIGRRSVIDYMIDNTNEKARTTGLKYKIEILM
ncbi:MAG: ATP-binding domain-containing protein, partial [Clostridia bacterium]|nr:ATP-binding domain-containing protein [Clostridia bacterium]